MNPKGEKINMASIKVLELANKIGKKKMGSKNGLTM